MYDSYEGRLRLMSEYNTINKKRMDIRDYEQAKKDGVGLLSDA